MRDQAISWTARLAHLLLPRPGLCRQVLLDDAGIGDVPHSMENAASPPSLPGFESVATTSWAVTIMG